MVNFFQHVPLSALIVLGWLIWRGVRACHDSVLPVSRAIFLPLVVWALSVWTMLATAHEPVLPVCWLLAAGSSFGACRMLHYPALPVFEDGSRRVRVAGSPLMLLLMLTLYCAHFASAAFNAMHPGMDMPMAGRLGLMLVYGSAAGVFQARLLGLARLAAERGLLRV